MKKRNIIPLVLVCFLAMTMMAAPVEAITGLEITNCNPDCDTITSRTGSTSAEITITDQAIPMDGNITIDITQLGGLVANSIPTNANVKVDDTAVDAIWTRDVIYDDQTGMYILTLTSTEGVTVGGETVSVTFTGEEAGNTAWIPDTGDGSTLSAGLTATRTDDTFDPVTLNIVLDTSLGPGSLSIAPNVEITSTDGATSMVITVTEEPILQNDTISMAVYELDGFVVGGTLTDTNVEISDTAVDATWTGIVSEGMLILTSSDGTTAVDENITVNFTGAAGGDFAWKPDTVGAVTLYATRGDTFGTGEFNFVIDTTPPVNPSLVADFIASPTSAIAPAVITFTDTSTGSPTSWLWDFGDGSATSTDQYPSPHTYTEKGPYTVSLTVSDGIGISMVSKMNYINVFNGVFAEADTSIPGLTITNCRGLQSVTVDTSILTHYTLSPGNSELEIRPPPESGFEEITLYARDGIGFSRDAQNQNLITGDITGVHLVSVDIFPPLGFSDTTGKFASFNYSIELPSYPCNAKLRTTILEGITSEDNIKLQKITSGVVPVAVPIGTAYTVKITKTNFRSGASAKIHMSVNSSWNDDLSGGPGDVYIWRIADDGKSGQILRTQCLHTTNDLDYCEADSPLGLSTFGLTSLTGANNPFQMIAFVAAKVVNQGGGTGTNTENAVTANAEPGSPSSEIQGGGIVVPKTAAPTKPPALSQPAMSTNVGMAGWLLAIIQDYPIILVGIVGGIAAVAYFGWWKRRL